MLVPSNVYMYVQLYMVSYILYGKEPTRNRIPISSMYYFRTRSILKVEKDPT